MLRYSEGEGGQLAWISTTRTGEVEEQNKKEESVEKEDAKLLIDGYCCFCLVEEIFSMKYRAYICPAP